MALIHEIQRQLESLKPSDLDQLAPVERRRLADLLRHWAKVAERDEPKGGVLRDLKDGNGE